MTVLVPRTLGDARAMRAAGGTYAAGLTALQVASGRGLRTGRLIDLSELADLRGIVQAEGMLRIGAMTPLETVRRSPLVEVCAPALRGLLANVASLQVRHLATIGGNLAWGAGDLVPALLALGALVEIRGERLPLEAALEGGLLEGVLIPVAAPDWSYAEKVGFRAAFSPSVVTVAATARIVSGRLHAVRLAIGGGPNPPQRLPRTETLLTEMAPRDVSEEAVRQTIRAEARCGEGGGLSPAHRARTAGNLLAAALVEARAWP